MLLSLASVCASGSGKVSDVVGDKELYEFLIGLGTDEISHTGHDFLTHLKSVQSMLSEAGSDIEVTRAGLFHSIYGTEGFQDFTLSLDERVRVRAVIGERAEFTVFCNCVMDRSTFDAAIMVAGESCETLLEQQGPFEIRDRVHQSPISLTQVELRDLAEVHLFDWLEQVERSDRGWDYRRDSYRRMAHLVGPRAMSAYDKVFGREEIARKPV